jgi:uncharacterized HAD superfamily protein
MAHGNKNRRDIYVDFDDVLCETAQSLLKILKHEFGKQITYDEVISFDLATSFKLTSREVKKLLDIAHSREVLLSTEPIKSTIEPLQKLDSAGYKINIVTGRPACTRKASEEWLLMHAVPFYKLFFADKYQRAIAPGKSISTISMEELKKQNYSFAIEDSMEMALFIMENMKIPVFLLARPWNRRFEYNGNSIKYLHNISTLDEIFYKYANLLEVNL